MDELGFANDRPIKVAVLGLLGRSAFAKNLAAAIVGWKNQESLVITMTGLWGQRQEFDQESGHSGVTRRKQVAVDLNGH